MNIFVTSECPVESAAFLDDKRVVKMVLETAQMLCTALQQVGVAAPYKATHVNHPCNVWARESRENWEWLWEHGKALAYEYYKRYDKVHKSAAIYDDIYFLKEHFPSKGLTSHPNCARNKDVGIDCTNIKDIHQAYRLYLSLRWEQDKREPTWYGVGA